MTSVACHDDRLNHLNYGENAQTHKQPKQTSKLAWNKANRLSFLDRSTYQTFSVLTALSDSKTEFRSPTWIQVFHPMDISSSNSEECKPYAMQSKIVTRCEDIIG